jgi:hypothetical protein
VSEAEVPDLHEQRLRRVLRWLEQDPPSQALLEEHADDPIGTEKALNERVEKAAPDDIRTFLQMTGGTVGKLLNINKLSGQLHVYQSPADRRSPVRVFATALMATIQVGSVEPCMVQARIQNNEDQQHEVELTIDGWFRGHTTVDGGSLFVVPRKGHVDARLQIMIPVDQAPSVPAGLLNLEVVVAVRDVEGPATFSTDTVSLEVLPYRQLYVDLRPRALRASNFNRAWVPYELTVWNGGNYPVSVEVYCDFDRSSLRMRLEESSCYLSPDLEGKAGKVLPLQIRPVADNISLYEREHIFQLHVAANGENFGSVSGVLWQPPILPAFWAAVIIFLIVITLFGFLNSLLASDAPVQAPPAASEASNIDQPMTSSSVTARSESTAPPATTTLVHNNAQVAVVLDFYEAINQQDYHRAYLDLLTKRRLGRSFEQFKDGFANTIHVTTKVVKTTGAQVTVRLYAKEGSRSDLCVYELTYTVVGGRIDRSTRQQDKNPSGTCGG